jgi:hypothetical protein
MAPTKHLAIVLLVAACGSRQGTPGPAGDETGRDAAGADRAVPIPDASSDLAAAANPDQGSSPPPDLGPAFAADLASAGDVSRSEATDLPPAASVGVLTPQQHQFPATVVGTTSAAATFTLSNPGVRAVTALRVQVGGGDFSLAPAGNTCAGVDLPAGASCSFGVRFKPASPGAKSGQVVVSSGVETVTAALTGQGRRDAQLHLDPTQILLTALPGGASPPIRVTVSNAGEEATAAVSVSLGGTYAADFSIRNNECLPPLAPAASCRLDLAFNPATPGLKTATLTATSTSGGMVVASVTGLASALTITPGTAYLGIHTVYVSSPPMNFEVKNAGGSASGVLTADVNGSNVFTIKTDSCSGASLAPGATCAVSVVFRPIYSGGAATRLTISSASGHRASAELTGDGH